MLKKLFAPIDMTQGKIYKVILLFMVPIFLSYIFQQIYTLTDAIIVGQNLSANEVNGVNDVGSLTYIVLQFAYGCAAGFSVISSESQGEHDLDGVRKSFFTQLVLSFFISIFLTVISIPTLLALAFNRHLAFICLVFLIIIFILLMGIIFLSILGIKYHKAKSIVLILITIATIFDMIVPLFSVNLLVKIFCPTLSLIILILCTMYIIKRKSSEHKP